MKERIVVPLLICLICTFFMPLPVRSEESDFQRFRAEMLETTRARLKVDQNYRDCLAEAADKDDYFFCRDMRDQALNLQVAARVGRQLNPDKDFVWDEATSDLYLQVTERAIQGKKDTLYCLEHVDSMETYEKCLVKRRQSGK